MLHQNQRVVDNPVYLCDLGASLSAADPEELQKIMEEMDVCKNQIKITETVKFTFTIFLSDSQKTFISFSTFEKVATENWARGRRESKTTTSKVYSSGAT